MSRNMVFVLLALGLFGAWRHFDRAPETVADQQVSVPVTGTPAAAGRSVVVYGRDRCGYTRQTLQALAAEGVPVTYVSLDDAEHGRSFHAKFDHTRLGDDLGGYALPVVEVAGNASMRPDPAEVAREFRNAL